MISAAPEIQYCSTLAELPSAQQFTEWAHCVAAVAEMEEKDRARSFVVRLVDREEMAAINGEWRNKAYATNVLAFPFAEAIDAAHIPLGDIIICAPVVLDEARDQAKPFIDRLAHIFIHGMLHLLGYDHQSSAEAEIMEAFERDALARLGYASPYESNSARHSESLKG